MEKHYGGSRESGNPSLRRNLDWRLVRSGRGLSDRSVRSYETQRNRVRMNIRWEQDDPDNHPVDWIDDDSVDGDDQAYRILVELAMHGRCDECHWDRRLKRCVCHSHKRVDNFLRLARSGNFIGAKEIKF